MLRAHRLLLVALACSLLLHLSPFVSERLARWLRPAETPARPPLQATLRPPPQAAATPPLSLPEPPPKAAKPTPPEKPRNPTVDREKRANLTVDRQKAPKNWRQAVLEQFRKQQDDGLFYPEAAVRAGLEGTPTVLLVLDENGHVAAARIEESCGHAILDAAALRAVRALRSLPADAPREMLLPVRFRLRP